MLFQVISYNNYMPRLNFINNSVNISGDVLYGCNVDTCSDSYLLKSIFNYMYTQQNTSLSVISSDPIQICFCEFCEQVINRNEYFQCFFQPINLTFDDIMPQAHLYFINNSANISGDVLYGSNLDSCFSLFYYYTFKSLFNYTHQKDLSIFSSDPIQI